MRYRAANAEEGGAARSPCGEKLSGRGQAGERPPNRRPPHAAARPRPAPPPDAAQSAGAGAGPSPLPAQPKVRPGPGAGGRLPAPAPKAAAGCPEGARHSPRERSCGAAPPARTPSWRTQQHQQLRRRRPHARATATAAAGHGLIARRCAAERAEAGGGGGGMRGWAERRSLAGGESADAETPLPAAGPPSRLMRYSRGACARGQWPSEGGGNRRACGCADGPRPAP